MSLEQQACSIDCWNRIGVRGDRTCPELLQYDHCHNCPVYAKAGRGLLDRYQPDEYIQDSTWLLEIDKKPEIKKQASAVIFRLGHEKFALKTNIFHQIYDSPTCRRIPHMRSPIILGLVNLSGELQLCVSLAKLLDIEYEGSGQFQAGNSVYSRIAVIVDGDEKWAFPTDEIFGVLRFAESQIQTPPSTVAQSSKPYTKGLIHYNGELVGLLDESKLFEALKRSIY